MLPVFLSTTHSKSALDGGEWRFTIRKKKPGTHFIGAWWTLQPVWISLWREKFLTCWESNPDHPVHKDELH